MDADIVPNGDRIPFPSSSDSENDFNPETEAQIDPIRLWQLKVSKRKKDLIKVKSRIKSCQTQLEEQDEQLKSLQEQIAKRRASIKKKDSDLTAVRTAHLISKVFEFCEPVAPSDAAEQSNRCEESTDTKSKDIKESSPTSKSKCLYTADFHRFAIALYFFSPKAYFFLSNIAPMFPHRNYIRQWVTSGKVEKLFPHGVDRGEGN